jgi:hypothetical protein
MSQNHVYIYKFLRGQFFETKEFPAWPNLSLIFKCNSIMMKGWMWFLAAQKGKIQFTNRNKSQMA